MIVFAAAAVVSAALKIESVPERALLRAEEADIFAISAAVAAEIIEVLGQPKFRNAVASERREQISATWEAAIWYAPTVQVTDCADAKNHKYL